jgi:hypothetical protein
MAATDTCDVCGRPVDLMGDETRLRVGFLCERKPRLAAKTRGTRGLIVTCRPACARSRRILDRDNFEPADWDQMVSEHRQRMLAASGNDHDPLSAG